MQAKRRKATIGVKAIQEIFTAMEFYQANHAILIITGKFSRPALQLAEKLGIECWDWERF